jgi:cobalt/nickel transport system permease protein
LNGLVGMILGRRAALAVAVGLLLQMVLVSHGGYSTLGINCCIIGAPALLARPLYRKLTRTHDACSFRYRDGFLAVAYILHPMLMFAMVSIIVVARRSEWRWPADVEFRAGFLIGFGSVLLTAVLNATVLIAGGTEDWRVIAAVVVGAHVPIAFAEGIIVGFTASFLSRVKPDML